MPHGPASRHAGLPRQTWGERAAGHGGSRAGEGGGERKGQADVMVSRPWPFETIVMAILLEQEKRVEEMVKRLEELLAGKG